MGSAGYPDLLFLGMRKSYWKYIFHPSWLHPSPFFQQEEWFICHGKFNILSFNLLPTLHDLWSEKPWEFALLIRWADQVRPDWVNPAFFSILIVSLGDGSALFNRENNRNPCLVFLSKAEFSISNLLSMVYLSILHWIIEPRGEEIYPKITNKHSKVCSVCSEMRSYILVIMMNSNLE